MLIKLYFNRNVIILITHSNADMYFMTNNTNLCNIFFSLLDPNALAGQTGPDHALIGGIVAVVVFVTLCSIFLLGRYLARHKGGLYLIVFLTLTQIF